MPHGLCPSLKKTKKTILLKMCEDIGIDVKGKKKEELVDLLFTNGVPALHITGVTKTERNGKRNETENMQCHICKLA